MSDYDDGLSDSRLESFLNTLGEGIEEGKIKKKEKLDQIIQLSEAIFKDFRTPHLQAVIQMLKKFKEEEL